METIETTATANPASIHNGRGSIISLLTMLKFAAHDFQELMALLPNFRGSHLQVWEIGVTEPDKHDEYLASLNITLERMETLCIGLDMKVSALAIRRLVGLVNSETESIGFWEVTRAITEIESRIYDELSGEMFLHLRRDDSAYFNNIDWFGLETVYRFQSTEWDVIEAGKCFALERYTACIIHLMRVLEFGLASLATALGVEIGTNPSWHPILIQCEKRIGTLKDHDPDWRENEPFYHRAAMEFRHFQRAVRNRTAHAHDRYGDGQYQEVKDLMEHVASFMRHLSTRLAEVPMPK